MHCGYVSSTTRQIASIDSSAAAGKGVTIRVYRIREGRRGERATTRTDHPRVKRYVCFPPAVPPLPSRLLRYWAMVLVFTLAGTLTDVELQ